jgi:hypothetical protein
MLDHMQRRRLGQVEDLTADHPRHRPAPQPGTTTLAAVGHMPHPHIRIIDQPQRPALMARLSTRLTAALTTQRLGCGFGRTVRGRRLMRIGRVHPQPGLQLDDPGLQLGDQRIPLGKLPQQLFHQRNINHPTMIKVDSHKVKQTH